MMIFVKITESGPTPLQMSKGSVGGIFEDKGVFIIYARG